MVGVNGDVPAALVPWFFAGSFVRITSMPVGLTWIARVLPVSHALALMRYGLVDRRGSGLPDIWGMHGTTVMASLSLGVVTAFALGMLAISVKVFTRTAVQ
jgi:hypothetical protein